MIFSSKIPLPLLASKQTEKLNAPALSGTVVVIGILGLIFNVCTIFIGFHHTLYDRHGFRQTQSAMNVESMLPEATFLRYETPVLGPPWSLPFEFPLYQWIVAAAIKLLGTPLEETGRAISILFFYLCFLPLASILHRLRFRRTQIVIALAIFSVSPLYIFWSRVFMIESTALFFSLMYVEQMVRLTLGEWPWRYRYMMGSAAFGILGGLVKVTTFAPYFVLGVGVAVWQAWKFHRSGTVRPQRIAIAAFLSGLLPVAFTDLWTKFADSVKAQNPFGVMMTSKALWSWNFGTIAQRFHLSSYRALESRIDLQIGYHAAAVLILGLYVGMLVVIYDARPFRRWHRMAAICVVLYVGTTMLFFNLHLVHDYYPYSTALFLVIALGALIAPTIDLPGGKAWVGVALLLIEMASCAGSYWRNYYPIQSRNYPGRPDAAAVIDQTTSPESVILVTGLDWSPELPYQSQRRAIMDPNWPATSNMNALRHAVENEGRAQIAAVVACDTRRNSDRVKELLEIIEMDNPVELHADDCDIYERNSSK